jgi:Ala-tRNA(Pro) deacylase
MEDPMPVEKLKKFLNENEIRFVCVSHSPAFTAQEIAASAHIPGKEVAKTVMVEIDGDMAMAVLPASYQVDLDALAKLSGARSVELASEQQFETLFPECEAGAMPPFGNLYGLPVYAAETLAEDEEIAFNAGSHTELVRLAYKDFARLVDPRVGRFEVHA